MEELESKFTEVHASLQNYALAVSYLESTHSQLLLNQGELPSGHAEIQAKYFKCKVGRVKGEFLPNYHGTQEQRPGIGAE